MRLFTGISLPPEVRGPLLQAVEPLRSRVKLSWTPEAKLHITTKFIGEWPEARLEEMQRALAGVSVARVDVRIRGLLWMSGALCAGVEMADEIHRATEDVLERLGIAREQRVFRPHVTLGRTQRPVPVDLPLDLVPFRAHAFHLYLSANGTYTKLSDYPLPS